MRSLMTTGCEMKKPQYFENLITKTARSTTRTTLVALGDPFPGPKTKYKCKCMCNMYTVHAQLHNTGKLVTGKNNLPGH